MKLILKKLYVKSAIETIFPQMELKTEIEDGEILIGDPIDFQIESLKRMPSLKWIQSARAGYETVDMEYIQKHHIKFTNAKGLYSSDIAEDIMNKIFIGTCHSMDYWKQQQKHIYQKLAPHMSLEGKTVGFLGTGSIAIETAKRLQPFGVRVIGYRRSKIKIKEFHDIYTKEGFHDFLEQCDILVLSSPLNEATYHMMNKEAFHSMKQGAILINISRGGVIDETALTQALSNHRIAFAGLDVFEEEPLPSNSALFDLDNVFLTPHTAGISDAQHEKFSRLVIDNIHRYLNEEPLVNLINNG